MSTAELRDGYFKALEVRTQVQRKVIELKVKVDGEHESYLDFFREQGVSLEDTK